MRAAKSFAIKMFPAGHISDGITITYLDSDREFCLKVYLNRPVNPAELPSFIEDVPVRYAINGVVAG